MNETPANAPDWQDKPPRERVFRLRDQIPVIIALVAIAIAAVTWYWLTRQPVRVEVGLPHGVIFISGCTAVTALIAKFRALSFTDVLEMLLNAILGVFWLIGMLLKGIWNVFLMLIGWR